MKWPTFLLIICAAALITPAQAQITLWSAPGDAFTLTIPKGWKQSPPELAGPTAILIVGPNNADPAVTGCVINRRNHTAAGEFKQADANTVLRGWDQRRVTESARSAGARNPTVTGFSNEARNSVQIVSLSFDAELADSRARVSQVQFMLAMGGANASFFTVLCTTPTNTGTADPGDIASFLSSLIFSKAGPL
jgi:hypothetical protein